MVDIGKREDLLLEKISELVKERDSLLELVRILEQEPAHV